VIKIKGITFTLSTIVFIAVFFIVLIVAIFFSKGLKDLIYEYYKRMIEILGMK
jgi:hypothetical protein